MQKQKQTKTQKMNNTNALIILPEVVKPLFSNTEKVHVYQT